MAIAADAKNLKVDTASSFDALFVLRAVGVVIAGDSAVRNVNIHRRQIYLRKKVLLHEEMKTLRMRSGQPQVFVEIEAGCLREIEIAGAVQRNQFFVQPQWSAAGGQAQNNCGVGTNGAGEENVVEWRDQRYRRMTKL